MSRSKVEIRANEFWELAEVFLQAYDQIREPWLPIPPRDWPRYFLLCHSVELALKAFLHMKGVSEREMRGRQYGHSLAKLFEAASNHGLDISERARLIPHYYNDLHMDGWSRYPMPEDKKTAPIAYVATFAREAKHLLREVAKHVPGAVYSEGG
jgi:hypothetical protein